MQLRLNVPGWERAPRVVAGVLLLAAAGLWPGLSPVAQLGIAAVGAISAITGLVGFCPACAVLGRRIRSDKA